jgi:hypothetical protein
MHRNTARWGDKPAQRRIRADGGTGDLMRAIGGHRLVRLVAAGMVTAALMAACGSSSSSSGTTYWQAHFTGGSTLYMSIVNQNGDVSGWAKYEDGTFQAFTGTQNSDGTLDVGAYDGDTLSISGASMTATSEDGEGTVHWTQTTQSDYHSAGGPSA